MAEMKACLKRTGVPRVVHWAWQTMKDLSRAGCWAASMGVTRDALMNLAFHSAVMWANLKPRDSEMPDRSAGSTTKVS